MYYKKPSVTVRKGSTVRVWIAPQGVGPNKSPALEGLISPGPVEQEIQTFTKKFKVPSKTRRSFETVGRVDYKAVGNVKTSLANRFPADLRSIFLKLAQRQCEFDMMWVFGDCDHSPMDYMEHQKICIFENVLAETYEHDTVGGFSPAVASEDALERLFLNAENIIDREPFLYRRMAYTSASTEILDVLVAEIEDCKCPAIIMLAKTYVNGAYELYLHYSVDWGVTWAQYNIGYLGDIDAGYLLQVGYRLFISYDAAQAGNSSAPDYYLVDLRSLNNQNPYFLGINSSANTAGLGQLQYNSADHLIYAADQNGVVTSLDLSRDAPTPKHIDTIAALFGIYDMVAFDGHTYIYNGGQLYEYHQGRLLELYDVEDSQHLIAVDNQILLVSSDGIIKNKYNTIIHNIPVQLNDIIVENKFFWHAAVDGGVRYAFDGGNQWMLYDLDNGAYQEPSVAESRILAADGSLMLYNGGTLLYADDTPTPSNDPFNAKHLNFSNYDGGVIAAFDEHHLWIGRQYHAWGTQCIPPVTLQTYDYEQKEPPPEPPPGADGLVCLDGQLYLNLWPGVSSSFYQWDITGGMSYTTNTEQLLVPIPMPEDSDAIYNIELTYLKNGQFITENISITASISIIDCDGECLPCVNDAPLMC